MGDSTNNKTKHIDVRVSADEYSRIEKLFKQTTCRKLSEYSRKVLLGKPLIGKVRDQSLDDFMTELIGLRKELNAVGNNFNQAVKKLHTLHLSGQFEQWIIATELDRRSLQKSIEAIEKSISKIADKWLQ
jgi:predicted transglutaminase-like cysteine proteinase